MSYDIYLEIDTGAGETAEVWCMNYTSNVSPMWRKALEGTEFEFLGAMDGRLASDCAPALRQAVAAMLANPLTYKVMNPANGWGDADGARGVLEDMATACEQHPLTKVRISR